MGVDRPGMPLFQPRATVSSPTGFDATLSIRGGGRDYFNLKVELEARRCGALSVNGLR